MAQKRERDVRLGDRDFKKGTGGEGTITQTGETYEERKRKTLPTQTKNRGKK